MKRIMLAVVVAFNVAAAIVNAGAAATLLAEFQEDAGGSQSVSTGFPKPIGSAFGLSYPGEFGTVGIGWDFVFPLVGDPTEADKYNVTGEATFNALNSRDWDITAARLTNGLDEILSAALFLVNPSGELGAGGGGGNWESALFGTPLDLTGHRIEFIIVRPNAIVTLSSCGAELCLFQSYTYSAEWEIWGTKLSNIPEPTTLALFALGLAGLGFVRRKRLAK